MFNYLWNSAVLIYTNISGSFLSINGRFNWEIYVYDASRNQLGNFLVPESN
jgi:hypothetical protein